MAKKNLTKTQAKKIALDVIGNSNMMITDGLSFRSEACNGEWTEDDLQMIFSYVDSICESLIKKSEKL